jgi:hypothetical protein
LMCDGVKQRVGEFLYAVVVLFFVLDIYLERCRVVVGR